VNFFYERTMINFALFAGTITQTTNVDRLCRSELLSIANDRCTSRSLIGRRVNNVCAFNTHQPSTIRVVSDHTRADNWCAFVYSLCGGLRSACADHRDVFSITIRYDTIGEFNVDWKAEYSALSSTRSQTKKLKQTTPVPL